MPAVIEKRVEEHVSQSRIMSYLTCPRKDYYEYVLGLKPKRTESYFIEGTFGHYGLEHWYTSKLMLRANMIKKVDELLAGEELTQEEDEDYRVRLSAMIGACHAYKVKYAQDHNKYKILAVEKPFELELGGVKLKGRLDWVAEDVETGTLGFMEHKFVSQFPRDIISTLPLTLQQLVYCLAVENLFNKKPDWFMWNMIRKSSLRRKGVGAKDRNTRVESLQEFEVRVQQQYTEKPDEMFLRTPPRKVEWGVVEKVASILTNIIKEMKIEHKDKLNFSSCVGLYGTPCVWGPACVAYLNGHKEGWNAPECMGLYCKHVKEEDTDGKAKK